MATLNLLPFIATQNAFARREERVPVWIHSTIAGYDIPESLSQFTTRIENYLNGIRLFGQEQGRKEDGYGERTYHLKDLENVINIYRSIGLAKSYPDFISDFKKEEGWDFIETEVITTNTDGKDHYKRVVKLGDETLEELDAAIKEGTCTGLDCVDYSGVIHRNCTLLKISDLHPTEIKKGRQYNPDTEKFDTNEFEIAGVDSELYLIITPECMEKGFSTVEGETEATLKASPFLRSPLAFVTMRRSRMGEIVTRFPKGTALLKSMCPVMHEYHEFDSLLAKATLVVQDTNIPGVIYKAIAQHNNQAFLTTEHLEAQRKTLDYALSPKEEKDGIANIYKNWMKLTGQHHSFSHILHEALVVFNAIPRAINDKGARAGQDLRYVMLKVLDIEFNCRWAIVEEFEAMLNPKGIQSGTSSIMASNPVPYYIHTLNPETLEWEKDPITKWIMCDTRGRKFYTRNENPFNLVNVNELPKAEVLPLPDVYRRIEDQHKAMVDSLAKPETQV